MPPPNVPKATFNQILKNIPKPQLSAEGTLRFSFKYAQIPGSKPFSIAERDADYFIKVLERLVNLSGMKTSDFVGKKERSIRNHSVNWNDNRVSQKGFTCLNEATREQADPAAFQFSVSKVEHGRVVGFLIGDTFFFVWCDPDHALYPYQE